MFIELARKRRSVRSFTDQPVEEEQLARIVESALRSPSGRSKRPYHLLVVTDRALIDQMVQAKTHGGLFLSTATAAIVVCGDPTISDMWIEDSTIAAVTMQYAATDLGLGSCWAQIRARNHSDDLSAGEYLTRVLELPEHLDVECVLGIGYPAQQPVPLEEGALKYDRVSFNSYLTSFKES